MDMQTVMGIQMAMDMVMQTEVEVWKTNHFYVRIHDVSLFFQFSTMTFGKCTKRLKRHFGRRKKLTYPR